MHKPATTIEADRVYVVVKRLLDILIALILSVLLLLIAALIPAKIAAGKDPVEALRTE